MINVTALIQNGTIIIEKDFSVHSLETAPEEISVHLCECEHLLEIITQELDG